MHRKITEFSQHMLPKPIETLTRIYRYATGYCNRTALCNDGSITTSSKTSRSIFNYFFFIYSAHISRRFPLSDVFKESSSLDASSSAWLHRDYGTVTTRLRIEQCIKKIYFVVQKHDFSALTSVIIVKSHGFRREMRMRFDNRKYRNLLRQLCKNISS